MQALRVGFASYIPFSHPEFHRHFSEFALQAIEIDRRYGRWCYPVGGPLPPPEVPIEDQLPYIFPSLPNHANQPAPAPNLHFLNHPNQSFAPPEFPFAEPFPTGPQPGNASHQSGPGPVADNQGSGGRSKDPSRRRHKKRKCRSRRNSSSDSSDSAVSDYDYPFAKRDEVNDKSLPLKSKEIRRYRDEYRSNTLKDAVDSFCWVGNKPPDFPGALVWDLLQYNYIELEKINAGVIPNSSELVHKATDKDAAAKIKPRVFSKSGEWRNTLSILRKALSAAFVSCFFYTILNAPHRISAHPYRFAHGSLPRLPLSKNTLGMLRRLRLYSPGGLVSPPPPSHFIPAPIPC